METIEIGQGEGKVMTTYSETDNMVLANEPDKKGAYVGYFKTAAIPNRPEDEYDRREKAQKISEALDKIVADTKLLLSSMPEWNAL